jgi:ribosome-associated heat shock protein Hsp15
MGGETQPASGSRQRIDKWLFFTRMVKSRSLAQSHVQSGHVRINGKRAIQPSQTVKAGDRVELQLDRRDVVLLVKLPGERRGPFEEAQHLYENITPPEDETKRLTAYEQAIRGAGAGRPTKKERRAIDRLQSGED